MQKPIVVVGSINLDLVAGADRIPQVGETITGSSFNTFHGGKGANQAVAAAKLGYPVAMVGHVGDDAFGSQLRSGLKTAGVNTDYVATFEGPSGVALITTGSSGENSIVVVPGTNGELTPQKLETPAPILERAGFLLAQLEIPIEPVEYLAQFALPTVSRLCSILRRLAGCLENCFAKRPGLRPTKRKPGNCSKQTLTLILTAATAGFLRQPTASWIWGFITSY